MEAEADEVELGERRERFEAVQRQFVVSQLGLEVEPRRERPLAGPLRIVVHDAVEDLQAVVTHAERISIGESEAELAANLAVILDDAVQLAADVLGRHLHAGKKARHGFLQRGILHRSLLSRWRICRSVRVPSIMPDQGSLVSGGSPTVALPLREPA